MELGGLFAANRDFIFIGIRLTGHILATHAERRSRTLLSFSCFDIYIDDGEIFYTKRHPPPARVRSLVNLLKHNLRRYSDSTRR